jgi:hypothetical protein
MLVDFTPLHPWNSWIPEAHSKHHPMLLKQPCLLPNNERPFDTTPAKHSTQ